MKKYIKLILVSLLFMFFILFVAFNIYINSCINREMDNVGAMTWDEADLISEQENDKYMGITWDDWYPEILNETTNMKRAGISLSVYVPFGTSNKVYSLYNSNFTYTNQNGDKERGSAWFFVTGDISFKDGYVYRVTRPYSKGGVWYEKVVW